MTGSKNLSVNILYVLTRFKIVKSLSAFCDVLTPIHNAANADFFVGARAGVRVIFYLFTSPPVLPLHGKLALSSFFY